jgi:hypothetical protein
MVHVQHMVSPPGVSWRKNYYNSTVGGNAGRDVNIANARLNKTTGWRNLPYGSVTPAFFSGTGLNSVAPITTLSFIK